MKALIDPRAQVSYTQSWIPATPTGWWAVYAQYPNSARVCEVIEITFPVAEPLFWVDCADDVLADQFWYDKENNLIFPVENAPEPQ